jgi:hypothetical protein
MKPAKLPSYDAKSTERFNTGSPPTFLNSNSENMLKPPKSPARTIIYRSDSMPTLGTNNGTNTWPE